MAFVYLVDRLNSIIGKTFGWAIFILTFVVAYEVIARYVFNAPTEWGFDASYMLYGTLFMLAGAYTLARNGHVRGDFLYRKWPPRRQAAMDLVLYFLFFFPGILACMYGGYKFAEMAFVMNEHSAASPNGPLLWPFKALIPITGGMMLLQGVAEVIRCIVCLREGQWPPRLHDVQELEDVILQEEAERRRQAAVNDAEETGSRSGVI